VSELRQVQRPVYGSDGVFYAVGSVPPDDIAAEFGEHIWQAPEGVASGGLLMPMVQAPTEPFAVRVQPTEPAPAPEPAKPAASPTAAPAGGSEAPPQSGPGSGVEAWRTYAAAHGVDVPEHAKRAEIVEALEVAGIPVE
jgi:hypothetical protein